MNGSENGCFKQPDGRVVAVGIYVKGLCASLLHISIASMLSFGIISKGFAKRFVSNDTGIFCAVSRI